MVHKPADLSVFAVTLPEPTTMLDEQIERYRMHRFMTASRRLSVDRDVFPVYVEASMPLDEAQAWLQLLVASIRLLVALALAGLLDCFAALRRLERDATMFEQWATLMRRLHQLRDEFEGGAG